MSTAIRTKILICCIAFSQAVQAQDLSAFARQYLLEANGIRNAHVGISLFDPDSNRFLYQYQSDHYFTPASNTKIPTCYLAMKYLGDSLLSFRVRENGDSLFIAPAGDPTFLNPLFPEQRFLQYLRSTSKKIWVQYNPDDSFTPYGSGWTWDGFQDSYSTERAAMPVFGNLVHFKRAAGNSFEVHPKLIGRPPYFTEPMIQLLTKGDRVEIDRHIDKNLFYFKKRSTPFADQQVPFKTDNGITNFLFLQDTLNRTVNDFHLGFERQTQGYQPVYSQPTDSMLRILMCESDNHLADQSLLMVSQRRLGRMNDLEMIERVLSDDFAKMPQPPRWTDGSGLSRYNLFTPDDFVFILDKMKKEFGMTRIAGIFPTGGVGTLKSYYNDIRNKIYAKTGTLSGVVTLSGFIQAASGKWLIFSVLVNNHRTTATVVRKGVEQFLQQVRLRY